jgi:putative ABC transport system ATP-binding protein
MSVLAGHGLGCERGGRAIFENLDFSVQSGERLAVLGASGSGKTTLLALLAGFGAASAGVMTFDGQPLDATIRRRFAVVLQGYGLVSLLTAAENVEAALRAAGRPPGEAMEAAHDSLGELGLAGLEDHLVEELSGGQQQRVAVARALALKPDVLLADEPTAEQDPASRALVLGRLLEVADRGGILVLATHDPEVAARCTSAVHIRAESELRV